MKKIIKTVVIACVLILTSAMLNAGASVPMWSYGGVVASVPSPAWSYGRSQLYMANAGAPPPAGTLVILR